MIFSFEIGIDSVAVACRDGGRRSVVAELTLPKASIQDGMVSDMDGLYKKLANEIADSGLRARQCEFVFPASFAITREISLPDVGRAKVLPLLKAQLEQSLPDIGNYVLDYIEFEAEAGKRTVLAVLLPVRLIEQYLNLANRLGLKCVRMDLRFARLRREIGRYVSDGAFIVVDLIPGEAEVSLFEGDRVFVKSKELTELDSSLADWGITFASAGPDSAEQAEMLAGVINSLIQFQTGRSREVPVEGIYAVGDVGRYRDMINVCGTALNRSITELDFEEPAPAQGAAAEG